MIEFGAGGNIWLASTLGILLTGLIGVLIRGSRER